MAKTLSDKQETDCCKVLNVTDDLAPRLLQMGIVPGSEVEIIRTTPLGFPMEIKIRGYSLSLRKDEASCIEIES